MLKKTPFFLLSLFFFVLTACQQTKVPANRSVQNIAFFDLETYFQEEINRLDKSNIRLTKKIILNGKEEEKRLEIINFSEELATFSQSNINKTAWLDLYTIDSIIIDNELQQVYYKAQDASLKTQEVWIDFEQKEVSKVKIRNSSNSILAKTKQVLQYEAQKGFSIENTQQFRFNSSEQNVAIRTIFL